MISKIGNNCIMRKAFTLVELIVTVTILSIGLVLILQAFSSSVKATELSQDMTKACILAENKISDLELKSIKGVEIPKEDRGEEDRLAWIYNTTSLKDLGLEVLNFSIYKEGVKKREILRVVTYLKR